MAYGIILQFNSETGVGRLETLSGSEQFAFDVPVPSDLYEGQLVDFAEAKVAIRVRPASTSGETRFSGFQG